MLLAFVVVFVAAYVIGVSWAARKGRAALLAAPAVTVALLVIGALLLGQRHAVPSAARLVLHVLAFIGPAIVLPPLLLSRRALTDRPMLPLALLGTVGGLLVGWVVVVFGLRVW